MKILFVMDSLRIGGIQTALINLLKEMDYSKYEVSLFLFHNEKRYKDLLPSQVKIIQGSKLLNIISSTYEEISSRNIFERTVRLIAVLMCRLFGADFVYNFVFATEHHMKEKYDCAIAYSNNITPRGVYYGVNKFVLQKVHAQKKISWLHVDYEKMNMNTLKNNKEYHMFDVIIHVSQAVKEKFLYYNPELKDRSHVIHNVIDRSAIEQKSKETPDIYIDKNIFNIITVGRLDKNKNQIECVKIAKRLKAENILFKWWIVGNGNEYDRIESAIQKEELQDYVSMIGYRENPFCIMKQCDLFVSTSLSESYGLAIAEAMYMNIPVIVKNYPAAVELIKNGETGRIVKDYDEMYYWVKKLVLDSEMYRSIRLGTSLMDYDDSMQRLYQVLEN